MKIQEIITEDGRIVSGVNTTVDVKPGETERQAAKFFGYGKPKELHKKARKNSDPNTLYNMGLVEAIIKQSDIIKVISNIAVRSDGKSHPVKFYDGGVINVKPTTAEKILNLYDRIDDKKKQILDKYLPTYNGFKEIAKKVGAVQEAENPKFDDVGQKIYKGGTTRVVHTPVADKNISTLDQRVDKFASDRDTYNAGTNDATMSTKGTNELIAKAKSNIKQAYNKQDAVDARQGAGQSYITKGKPVKFDPKNSSSNIKLSMD